jgi:hypothetical protein
VDILPVVNLDFGIHFNVYNLFGKQYTTNVTSHERLNAYTGLNDDKDPLFNTTEDHIIGESRSLNALQVTVTAMIGL